MWPEIRCGRQPHLSCSQTANHGPEICKTKTGWTSLHYSSMKGYTALVEFLVKKHNATIDSMTIVSGQAFQWFSYRLLSYVCPSNVNLIFQVPVR